MADTPIPKAGRSDSISQASENSQTAQDFINTQLQLEADAREVLPYQFDTCSRPLGPLRQKLWSCLSCNPPPSDPAEDYTPAGVCYSCHVSCHGEHTLVELFAKRNFVCDCGTTRIQSECPCTLRINESTGLRGDVRGESPALTNHYDHNYRNRFCGCGQDYDAHEEKGTMFQCLGLGTVEDGGCGEDWWHPECVVGLPRDWFKKDAKDQALSDSSGVAKKEDDKIEQEGGEAGLAGANGSPAIGANGHNMAVPAVNGDQRAEVAEEAGDEPPNPPGFPGEEEFEHFICYKCVEAFPWIKRYAGAEGFLSPVYYRPSGDSTTDGEQDGKAGVEAETSAEAVPTSAEDPSSKKRKASDIEDEVAPADPVVKRQRSSAEPPSTTAPIEPNPSNANSTAQFSCHYSRLPTAPTARVSLFLTEDFRAHLCRCPSCFPQLSLHPYLLDEEDVYEPPVSESDGDGGGNNTGSIGSRSLLDRGEAALSNMDRVRAIEGVMVYNHLKDKVKDFLKPFAESGTPVGAEDIKRYFERLRGDADGIMAARGDAAEKGAEGDKDGDDGAGRREQSGY